MLPRFVSESRLWRGLTHPWARLGTRMLRVGALSAGIFGAGYSYGVQSCLDDPEGMGMSILRQVLKNNTEGHEVMSAESAESQMVSRLGEELLVAARKRELQTLPPCF